ncbi:shikimate kinase [Brachybacterium sp. DNPG3]
MTGPRVVLLGPMGAGKTSIGRELAALLGVGFADLDALIVEADGRPIPEIFAADGEEAFRVLEARVLEDALVDHDGVLALGGGTITHERSRALLRGRPVVMLEVDERTVSRRIGRGHGRPLLSGGDPMERWRSLSAERDPLYRAAARWHVDSAHGSATAVARRIIEIIERDAPAREEERA